MKLHDHAVVGRCMRGPWLITGGKEGGGVENTCGLDYSIKAGRADELDSEIMKVANSECPGRVFSKMRKRGRPTLEIWGDSSSNS